METKPFLPPGFGLEQASIAHLTESNATIAAAEEA